MDTIQIIYESTIIFLIVDFLIFFLLLILLVKYIKKYSKLENAMDHYTVVNEPDLDKKELIADTIEYRQSFSKDVKLIELINGPRKDYYTEYYTNEVSKVIANRLSKAGAIKVEFIEGVEKDTIIGSVRYLLEV